MCYDSALVIRWIGTVMICLLLSLVSLEAWRSTPAAWLRDYGDCRLIAGPRSREEALRRFVFYLSFFAAAAISRAWAGSGAAAGILIPLLQLADADISYRILPDEWTAMVLLAGARSPAGLLPLLLLPLPIGSGDIKLLCALGFVVGLARLSAIMLCAFSLAGFYAAVLLLTGSGRKEQFAFAPFILLAYMAV